MAYPGAFLTSDNAYFWMIWAALTLSVVVAIMDIIIAAALDRWSLPYKEKPGDQKRRTRFFVIKTISALTVFLMVVTSNLKYTLYYSSAQISLSVGEVRSAQFSSLVFYGTIMYDLGMNDQQGRKPLKWNKWLHHIGALVLSPFLVFSPDQRVAEYAALFSIGINLEMCFSEPLFLCHLLALRVPWKVRLFTVAIPIKMVLCVYYCSMGVLRFAFQGGFVGWNWGLLGLPVFLCLDHTYDNYIMWTLKSRLPSDQSCQMESDSSNHRPPTPAEHTTSPPEATSTTEGIGEEKDL